jgi:hypothetical protein
LAGGQESELDLTDLELKRDFSTLKAMKNGTTQTTLAFEELAKSYPSISFIHKYPGFVNTGVIGKLMGTTSGLWAVPATLFNWLVLPVINLFSMGVEEAGERGLFLATSARYPGLKAEEAGVELPKGVEVVREESGVYRLGPKDDSVDPTPALLALRQEGASKTVWETTMAVWERALGRSD